MEGSAVHRKRKCNLDSLLRHSTEQHSRVRLVVVAFNNLATSYRNTSGIFLRNSVK